MSTRAQWMAILGGFIVLVLLAVILGGIVAAVRQSSEDTEQVSSSEASTEEPTQDNAAGSEEVAEETYETFDESEARKKRAVSEARTPEERVRALVTDMPQFEDKQVSVRSYNDNGCLDVLVKYRTAEPLFGILTQAETTEDEMKPIYESIHSDRQAHETVCDLTVAAVGDPKDDYGQKTDENLYQTTITRDKASRVNWSNIGDVNFYAVWRVDHIHPDVREEEEDENDRTVLDCVHDPDLLEAIGENCRGVFAA